MWNIKHRPLAFLLIFLLVVTVIGALFYFTTDVFKKSEAIKYEPLEFKKLMNGEYEPQRFNGTWVSGKRTRGVVRQGRRTVGGGGVHFRSSCREIEKSRKPSCFFRVERTNNTIVDHDDGCHVVRDYRGNGKTGDAPIIFPHGRHFLLSTSERRGGYRSNIPSRARPTSTPLRAYHLVYNYATVVRVRELIRVIYVCRRRDIDERR